MKHLKEGLKKNPYGITDFEIIRKENYYYIDKTTFIKTIEFFKLLYYKNRAGNE